MAAGRRRRAAHHYVEMSEELPAACAYHLAFAHPPDGQRASTLVSEK